MTDDQGNQRRFGYVTPSATSSEAIRTWDEKAIREYCIPGLVLMENAGEACVRVLLEYLEQPSLELSPPVHVVCGPGNNGGDGLVIARHLYNRGVESRVFMTTPSDKIRAGSDASTQLEIVQCMGIPMHDAADEHSPDPQTLKAATTCGTLVDAMFGTGLSRPLNTTTRAWVEAMNDSKAPVVAIDVPSGLHADTGEILGKAIRARWTLTFVAPKLGFELGAGPQCTGEVRVLGISIPRQELE